MEQTSKIIYDDTTPVTEITLKTDVVVNLPVLVYQQLMTYIKATDIEVSGLGHATMENGEFTVHDINFPKQVGSAGGTELNDEAISKVLVEKVKNGDARPLNFWWHSHVNMGTFWSGTDDNNCDSLLQTGAWFLSIVGCQNGTMRARVDFKTPFRLTIDLLPIRIVMPTLNDKRAEVWKKEVESKLEQPKPVEYQYKWDYWKKDDKSPLYTPYGTGGIYEQRIIPEPQGKRMKDGKVRKIKPSDDEAREWKHDIDCHVHEDGFACEECEEIGCACCQWNESEMELRRKEWAGYGGY